VAGQLELPASVRVPVLPDPASDGLLPNCQPAVVADPGIVRVSDPAGGGAGPHAHLLDNFTGKVRQGNNFQEEGQTQP